MIRSTFVVTLLQWYSIGTSSGSLAKSTSTIDTLGEVVRRSFFLSWQFLDLVQSDYFKPLYARLSVDCTLTQIVRPGVLA